MFPTKPMRLSTSRDLVRYHDARATLYAAFAAWFAGRHTQEVLPEGLHHRARALLPPHGPNGSTAHLVHLALPGTADALAVLAFLSERGALAFRKDELTEAAALLAAQRAFLDQHAATLLRQACARLSTSGDAVLRAIAASLVAVVDDDASVSRSDTRSPERNVEKT